MAQKRIVGLEGNRRPIGHFDKVDVPPGFHVSVFAADESPESTLVQTGPDTTVRITAEIVSVQKSPLSPMPTGLLRAASDQELADLYAWLQALGEEQE